MSHEREPAIDNSSAEGRLAIKYREPIFAVALAKTYATIGASNFPLFSDWKP
jgi:hypothetical protein